MSRNVPTFIIDQSALIREGLTRILASTRFRVSSACAELREVVRKIAPGDQTLVLYGSDLGSHDDFVQLGRFKSEHANVKIVMLSDVQDARTLTSAIEAGVDGFLSKQITSDALLKSIELVWMGETVVPSALLRMSVGRAEDFSAHEIVAVTPPVLEEHLMISSAHSLSAHLDRAQRLSCKEQLILRCLTQGASNKAIARELNMAEATVKVHIKGILRKIRVSNRTQAAVWALREPDGIVEGNA